jgi:acetylornithine/N-succinyldiaminopimelate aminotransferase
MKETAATSSSGMVLVDRFGDRTVDMAAALASSLGHRHPSVVKAIAGACEKHIGAPSDSLQDDWYESLGAAVAGFKRCLLFSSANEANEAALRLVRSYFGSDRYRVISLLGSDHGDSFLLRSASGRIESQGGDGPVVAGFRHVLPADINVIAKAIDSHTAAICISPVDWNRGGEAFDTDYLLAIEALCVEKDLLLMVDETRVPPGVGGTWHFHQRAGITPDVLTVSAGWTGGLSGGMTLVGSRLESQASSIGSRDFPLIRAAIEATARTIREEKLLQTIDEIADAWAAMLDELSSGFDFIRGCVHAGLWTTIELDLPAADVAKAALRDGMTLTATSETSLLLCPPLNVTDDSLLEAIEPLRRVLESIERETTSS